MLVLLAQLRSAADTKSREDAFEMLQAYPSMWVCLALGAAEDAYKDP